MNNRRRILGSNIDHPRPNQGPSRIEVSVDRGLASGKLDIFEVSVDEALSLAEQLIHNAIIVKRVNAEKGLG